MTQMIRDIIEIVEYSSLDSVIDQLVTLKNSLPDGSEAELQVKGDEIFGRKLCISFLRPHTPEEAECYARYQHVAAAQPQAVGIAA